MAEPLISARVLVARRYVRAVDLARDYEDPAALDGYVLTPSAREALERIARGLAPTSTQRAFRVTGPYGSGKSSFGVLLARLLMESDATGRAHEMVADASLTKAEIPAYAPLVLVGRRASMADEIVSVLVRLVSRDGSMANEPLHQLGLSVAAERRSGLRDIRSVLDLLASVSKAHLQEFGTGLLLLIDEMGRFIEYAAANPAAEDPSIFQQLAELCGGPGAHLGVVGFLHNRFSDYVAGLGGWAEGEWARSAERYEELPFREPAEQSLFLVAEALRPARAHDGDVESGMRDLLHEAVARGVFACSREAVSAISPAIYPLHPGVVASLAACSRRFGQNERSIFSFLQSLEPAGLQRHMSSTPYGMDGLYRADRLFDYLAGQGALRFRSPDRERRWHLAIDALALAGDLPPATLSVLKVIALLAVLEPLPGLPADADTLAWCLDQDAGAVEASLDALLERGLVHRRAGRGGYSLWSGSSVDLEEWVSRARAAVPLPTRLDPDLLAHTDPRRLVAHRHYHQTGHQRVFAMLIGAAAERPADADGVIRLIPVHPDEDMAAVIQHTSERSTAEGPLAIFNLKPVQPADLAQAHELAVWRWVRSNCAELRIDDLARGEVDRRVGAAEAAMQAIVAPFSQREGDTGGDWFQAGQQITIKDRRALSSLLSATCDVVFSKAPILRNELINRPTISKAIAAARTKLLELMTSKGAEPYLGLDGAPPERTIFLSLFKDSQLHREEDGTYAFRQPSAADPRKWRPVWDHVGKLLLERGSVRFDELIAELAKPPFGLRAGPALPLLASYLLVNRRNIALMERGSFQPELTTAHFMRLAKNPVNFALRKVEEEDGRREVLRALTERLGIWTTEDRPEPELTPVVEALYHWFNAIPEYTRRTADLSVRAREVRSAMRKARDPVALLFQDLPTLTESLEENGAIDVARMAEELDLALTEINEAERKLANLVRAATLDAFATRSIADLRRQIELDYAPHVLQLRDYRLRAFVERMLSRDLDEDALLDSIASLLAGRRLASWDDHALDRYTFEVRELAQRLARWLALARVAEAGRLPVAGVHLTTADGNERSFFVRQRAEAPGRKGTMEAIRKLLDGRSDADMILAELLAQVPMPEEKERSDA